MKPWKILKIEVFLLLLLLGLAAYLRLVNLRTFPYWYTDEGAFTNVSANLAEGKWQYFAIRGSPLLVGRPPFFFLLAAGLFSTFSTDILWIRVLASFSALLAIGLLYWIVRDMFGSTTAIWSAFLLAVLPEFVYYQRMGFTYSLLAPLFLLVSYAIWKYSKEQRKHWIILATVSAGIALATDYIGVIVVGVVAGYVLLYHRRATVPIMLGLILPLSFTLFLVAIKDPHNISNDLFYTIGRAGGNVTAQIANVIAFYGELIRRYTWVVLGLFGLFLLPSGTGRNFFLILPWLSIFFLIRVITPVGHGLFYLLPLFPFLALGMGVFLDRGFSYILSVLKGEFTRLINTVGLTPPYRSKLAWFAPALAWIVGISLLFIPVVWILLLDFTSIRTQSHQFTSFHLIGQFVNGQSNPKDVDAVATYIDNQELSSPVVLASPQVGWELEGKVADFQQLLSCEGEQAIALPALSPERFTFDCSLDQADYVVLDDLWRGWAVRVMPALVSAVSEVEQWPVVFESGEFDVYRNPNP